MVFHRVEAFWKRLPPYNKQRNPRRKIWQPKHPPPAKELTHVIPVPTKAINQAAIAEIIDKSIINLCYASQEESRLADVPVSL